MVLSANKFLFWFFFTGQSLVTVITAYYWPESFLLWVLAVITYAVMAVLVLQHGSRLAKLHNSYYAFSMMAIYLNWIVFGCLGSFASRILQSPI